MTFVQAQSSLYLSGDTVIEGSENFAFVRTNGYNLHVKGALNITNFILFNGGGVVTTDDDFIVAGTIFMPDGGEIRAKTGISVARDITGTGTVYWCTFFNVPDYDDTITQVQDCFLNIPLSKYIKNIPIGEEYFIYNELGQILEKRILKDYSELYSDKVYYLYFPKLNYSSRTILKVN